MYIPGAGIISASLEGEIRGGSILDTVVKKERRFDSSRYEQLIFVPCRKGRLIVEITGRSSKPTFLPGRQIIVKDDPVQPLEIGRSNPRVPR